MALNSGVLQKEGFFNMQLLIADREGGRAPPGEMDNFEEVDAKEPTPAKPHCKHGQPYKQNKTTLAPPAATVQSLLMKICTCAF